MKGTAIICNNMMEDSKLPTKKYFISCKKRKR